MFGTREDVERRVDEAVRLWRDGLFRWSIVSGGMTPGSDCRNATIISPRWSHVAFPLTTSCEEHRAMNTGENVIFSLPSSMQHSGCKISAA